MELPKEWEAIANEIERCVSGNWLSKTEGIRAAVERCFALHSKPPKELTDAEISAEWVRCGNTYKSFARSVIAAHEAKQREPERVKFRAARHKADNRVSMLEVIDDANLARCWEWLEPEQSFEVVLP